MDIHLLYDHQEWKTREYFIRTLETICQEQNIAITWLSGQWIACLQQDDRIRYVDAYTFPLNNVVAGNIMRDKVATAQVLRHQNIPAIAHYLLRVTGLPKSADLAALAKQLAPLPVVIKPNLGGSGGRGVYKCETPDELAAKLALTAKHERVLAVSPLAAITREFRVIVLDGQPEIIYEKQRAPGTWHHNLHFGATPVALTNVALRTKLTDLALATMDALQARLAAVDVVETPDGLQIMEVNGGITLRHFAEHSPANAAAAKQLYQKIMAKIFA